jgi:hypothetical protein
MVKLFMYKAKDANIVAILRRGKYRKEWQMIRWDIDNDTFQEGQWLMNKMIQPRYCSISPDGKYFFYHYWDRGQYSTDAVFSKIPNFTAEYYGEWNTYYNVCSFTNDNKGVVSLSDQFVKRNMNTMLELVLRKDIDKNDIIHIGYVGLRNHKNEFLKDNNMMEHDDSIDCPVYDYKFDEYYEKHATFTDVKGRIITINEGKLYADGNVILDTTNNSFVSVTPV